MKTPVLKLKDNFEHTPYIEGDFDFEISTKITYSHDTLTPLKLITFGWSPEMQQDLLHLHKDEYIMELFAEKLKQDFLKFALSKIEEGKTGDITPTTVPDYSYPVTMEELFGAAAGLIPHPSGAD